MSSMVKSAIEPVKKTRMQFIDWVSVVVLVLCAGWLSYWPGSASVPAPELIIETEPSGRRVAIVDYDQWANACDAAGLPNPPALNRADPVPVRVLFDAFQAWVTNRDAASVGRIGQIYQGFESHQPAIECFAAAAQMAPKSGLWNYHLGVECQVLGMKDLAIEYLERARQLEDDAYPTTLARLGHLYREQGHLELAAQRYQAYIQKLPEGKAADRSLGHIGLGRVAIALGDSETAFRQFALAVQNTPNDFAAHRLLAQELVKRGEHDQAAYHADIARQLPVYSGWLTFDERLKESRRIADTEAHYRSKLREALTNPGGLHDAIEPALELIRRRPDDHSMRELMARVYQQLARALTDPQYVQTRADYLRRAEAMLDEALAIKPDSAPAYHVRATLAFMQDDYERAMELIDTTLQLDPAYVLAVTLRGRTLYLMGQVDGGIEQMKQAKVIDSTNRSTRTTLAAMLFEQQRFNEYRAELNELITLWPLAPEAIRARFQLAGLELKSGQLDAATAWLNEVIELVPNSAAAAEAKKLLDSMNAGLPSGELLQQGTNTGVRGQPVGESPSQ